MRFRLYIYREGVFFRERLAFPFGGEATLPLFGLANAYLPPATAAFTSGVHPIIALSLFTDRLNGAYLGKLDPSSPDGWRDVWDEALHRFTAEVTSGMPEPAPVKGLGTELPEMRLGYADAMAWYRRLKEGHAEEPIPFRLTFGRRGLDVATAFNLEYLFIDNAFLRWLVPAGRGRAGKKGRRRPSERYADFWSGVSPLHLAERLLRDRVARGTIWEGLKPSLSLGEFKEALDFRTGQCSVLPVAIETTKATVTSRVPLNIDGDRLTVKEIRAMFSKCYTSEHGLLPLVWAEILYAVENDIFARLCPVCARWFPLSKKQIGQQTICSARCRSEAKRRRAAARRAGAIEAGKED